MKLFLANLELPLILLGVLAIGACNNTPVRGNFTTASCSKEERRDLPQGAAYALYVDKDGNLLDPFKDQDGTVTGYRAEDLTGTDQNKMCPTPSPNGPGSCPTGYCLKLVPGTNTKVCMRC